MKTLKQLQVVEFAQGIAGPLAGVRLADLGASVIKIESTDGDWMREAWPALPDSDESAAFFELNRGKRSLQLGDHLETAAAVVKKLLASADILIVDQRDDDTMDRLGLANIVRHGCPDNPGLIVIDISVWGPNGPMAGLQGSELTGQAMAGYTRYLGQAGQPARRLGADVGSVGTGIFAVQAALAALFWRDKGGRGQTVSLSVLNSLLSMKSIHLAAQSDPDAYAGPRIGGPFDPIEQGWKTADRPIFFAFGGSVGATGRAGWEQFVAEMGMDEMLDDPRFDKRGKNSTGHGSDAVRLRGEYEKHFATRNSNELVSVMHHYRANASVYATTSEALQHKQTLALDIVRPVANGADAVEIRAFPGKFSDLPTPMSGNAPALGEHTQEILQELGLAAAQIEAPIASVPGSKVNAP
ncbi:MAG TPA: CaiB/BaiF CoA-transferase family protein [Devosia sp.]|nr:CaiB/BaiF CoA-transferase family protein [Devosia sp.]